jgi:two-component system, cell cycle sensor histidine kinase and response regulator CckA
MEAARMFNFDLDPHFGMPGREQRNTLERENAELRQQMVTLLSQVSGRVPFEPAGLFFGEARYRALIELSPQAIWMADAAGNVVYTNRFWHQYSGLNYQQTMKEGSLSVVHPEDIEHTVINWRTSVQQGTPFENEARFRRASDGQYRWQLTRALPLKNEKGQVLKWVGISIDIHDRKMAAAALAESDERVRIAVEAAGMGTWDYYPETGETKWSARAKEIFGLTPEQGMNLQCFLERVHPEDRARIAARIQEAKDPQIASEYDVDYRIVMPDGSIRWVIARGKCYFTGSGTARTAKRFSGVVLNITERKRAEQERALLITVMQNSPDFIGVSDLEGKVLLVNRSGRKLTGLQDDGQDPGKSMTDYFPVEEQALLQEKIVPAIEQGEMWEGETSLTNFRGGVPTRAEVRAFGISDESGRLTSLAMIARDISEKKRMQERLMLAQKMDAAGKLAGGLAHDFGNLLTIIRGYGEILRERVNGDAENGRIVREICGAATKAATLTSQLLAFGKPQMVQPGVADLTYSVHQVMDMLQRLVGEHISIETELESNLWNAKVDPGQVDQVLINLAANARDAMPEGGGIISIKTQNCSLGAVGQVQDHAFVTGDYVKLSFSDTGAGMDSETLGRIFEPFFTTKKPGKGTGLGLATVHAIMQQVRGQISVFSEPERGTTFDLYFPRCSDAKANPSALPDREHLRGTESILLVEDDEGVRDMLEQCLSKAGYFVQTARNGLEGLGMLAQSQTIDLLITDIVMPGGSGRDLALSTGKLHPAMKIIFISARLEDTLLEEALRQPGTSFVPKPFSLKDMLAAVRRALDES